VRVPLEIPGCIFRSNITKPSDPRLAGIQEDSYDFLVRCRRWSQVAVLFRNSGATGVMVWKTGNDSAPILEPLRWISCWMERGAELGPSTRPSGILYYGARPLSLNSHSNIPTLPQMLSLLDSNPNIRSLALGSLKIKDDIRRGSDGFRVAPPY